MNIINIYFDAEIEHVYGARVQYAILRNECSRPCFNVRIINLDLNGFQLVLLKPLRKYFDPDSGSLDAAWR